MEELIRLIHTSYGSVDNIFAGHDLDKGRAAQSVVMANELQIGFEQFIALHRQYLTEKGCSTEHIEAQIQRVMSTNYYFQND